MPQALSTSPFGPGPQGTVVLRDFPGPVGDLLWIALRRVYLWLEVRRSEAASPLPEAASLSRERIFSCPPPVQGPLEVIAAIGSDARGTWREIADACVELAEWVVAEGSADVEIEFRQAAALACPADPSLTLALGKLHRDRAEYSRAEAWLQRTIGLAREADEWATYALGYIALGKMAIHRGAYPDAKHYLTKAVRRARRDSLAGPLGMALHDLHAIAADLGEWEEANRYAREALEAYGPGHRSHLRLAHDVAHALLGQGYFHQAHRIFTDLSDSVPEEVRAYFVGSYARSAAGVGREDLWEAMRAELREAPEGPGVAESWVEIAEGGALLGRFEEALEAVERGETVARSRGEGMIVLRAEGVREAIRAESAADSVSAAGGAVDEKAGARADARMEDPLVEELALEITRHLGSAG